ncbi:MAG: hypothetical protein NC935_07945 [Candidatus Omnitrophica bacterium]|nr:hypothetical protein [Candidatus Omnitrophota bacterium]
MKNILISILIFIFFFIFYSKEYKKIPIRYWDEHGWIGRGYYFDLYLKRDFKNDLWNNYYSYNQPKLAEYLYGFVLYPKYLSYKKEEKLKNYDFAKFLIDHNFYKISSKEYEYYKNSKNEFINWGKNPREVFDVSPEFLIKKFGSGIKKTINLVYAARKINILILSLTVVIVYLLSVILSKSKAVAILTSIFYGTNILIVNASLRAQSEGLFLFLFNLSLLLLILFFQNDKNSFKIGLAFFSVSAFLTATKLNGLMMPVIFNLIGFFIFIYKFFNKNKVCTKILKTLLFGNILFFFVFVFHHPLLIKNPLNGLILLFNHRYNTALHQAEYELPETALWSFKDRILAIYKNFFSEKEIIYYNNYFIFKNLISKHPKIFSYLFLLSFIGGLFLFIKEKIKLFWYFLVTFALIILFMGFYLMLNWDRYFVHLHFFQIFFIIYGKNFFKFIFLLKQPKLHNNLDLEKRYP